MRGFTLTVTDEQQHEGFVLRQVDDGLFVGVILRGAVWEDRLGLAGGERGCVFDHCRKGRDRKVMDLHILISRLVTGAGETPQ